ncbi:MAG: type II secretion system F family protein [Pseudomonadota bacterium]
MSYANAIVVTVFIAALLVGGFGLFAVAHLGGGRTRVMGRRLERLRERFSNDQAAVAQARARRLRNIETEGAIESFLRRFVPRPAALRARLNATGRQISVGQYAGLCAILLLLSFGTFWFIVTLPLQLSLLLSLLVGIGVPHVVTGRMVKRRIASFTTQFPDAIDLIVRGLRSGLPVAQSLGAVGAEFPDPVGVEFRTISDKIKIGKSMEQALWETAQRIPTADFKFFVITLAIQRETGGNLAETLGNLSDILRKRQQLKLKVRAMSSEGRASAYIVGALPFIMFGLILMLNYDYGIVLVTDPRAMTAAIGGVVWMSIGAFIMAKMINFEV